MATILITGASMGIGRALALAWARRGADLVLSARGRPALEEVANEARQLGARAFPVAGDVTDEAHRRELVRTAVEKTGRLDVLVNNAGRGFYAHALAVDLEEMRKLFELNVVAPLGMVQAAAEALERSRGTVVMMSSIAGVVAAPRYAAYSASKFALEAISMSMRAELAEKGIRVLVVRPGPVKTPFRKNATRARGEQINTEPDADAQPPEEVAALTLRAVDRAAPVVETSAYVRFASTAARIVPAGVRFALRRMAKRR